jgi:hypothetical protein
MRAVPRNKCTQFLSNFNFSEPLFAVLYVTVASMFRHCR